MIYFELIEELAMVIEARPLAEITKEALKVLYKEIGIVNTVRFLSQFTTGYGNYTREREQLFAGMTLDDIVAEKKRTRSETSLRE